MSTSLKAPSLATLVQTTRRESGETRAELALRTGLALTVVERVEQGEAVEATDLGALLSGLSIDRTSPVDEGRHGAVPPVDDDHARVMAYLSDVADVRDGWLALPDAAAYPKVDGWDEDAFRTSDAAVSGWTPSPVTGVRRPLAVTVTGHPETLGQLVATPFGWWSLSSLAVVVASFGALIRRSFSVGPDHDPHEAGHRRLLDLRSNALFREQKVRELSRRGFAVSAWGVTAYEVAPDGLVVREHPASSFRSVRTIGQGPGHVMVVVDTIVGTIDMPWLRRTIELADLVRLWSERARRPGPRLEGPQ